MSHLGRSRASSMAWGRTWMGCRSRLNSPAGTSELIRQTSGRPPDSKSGYRYASQY